MSWPALPVFVKVAGQPVILIGEGEAAEAKRRLLERAGAVVIAEDDLPTSVRAEPVEARVTNAALGTRPSTSSGRTEGGARLAIVALEDEAEAAAAAERLKARGLLVNVVDRPALCDFTLPAIVDRAPVLVAIGTGGVSAGLAAALRQRLEAILPAGLGSLATALFNRRERLRARFPDAGERRRALAAALSQGGRVDPLSPWMRGSDAAYDDQVDAWLAAPAATRGSLSAVIVINFPDPELLRIRDARWLAMADVIFHDGSVPPAILDRARADARRVVGEPPADGEPLQGFMLRLYYSPVDDASDPDTELLK